MGKAVEFREVQIEALKPYEGNAKKHSREQIEKLRKSISEVGFISPCLIDQDMNVIAGHGRIMAARENGLDSVPCVFVEGLTEKQRKAYIIADNRLAEFGDWDMDKISAELAELSGAGFDIGFLNFDVDIPDLGNIEVGDAGEASGTGGEGKKKGKAWKTRGVRCDMKPCIAARTKDNHRYISLYASSKNGPTLEEIKNSREYERQMTGELVGYIRESMGENLRDSGWAMITTGRRRHREGYHFATEVTRHAAEGLGLRFVEGAITCGNADRLKPELKIVRKPAERNLILFDDIITTGTTMGKTVDLLRENGYTVMTIIGIRNQ